MYTSTMIYLEGNVYAPYRRGYCCVLCFFRFIFYIFDGPKELEVSREEGEEGKAEKTFRYRREYIPNAFRTSMNFIPVLAVGWQRTSKAV